MKLSSRPYSIYAHSKKDEREGLWFRVRNFKTMESALHSLKGLTRTSKDKRDLIYTILPNQGDQRKYIIFKDEHAKNLIKSAR